MLEKAIFRRHTKLFLYMMAREHFSQKEIIRYSLENHEFKDKDSWENKGQFGDKMTNLGLLSKFTYREFKELYPNKVDEACIAYERSHERKRALFAFNYINFLALEIPQIKKYSELAKIIPLTDYAKICLGASEFEINELIDGFILGCSMQRVMLLKNRSLLELLRFFSIYSQEFDDIYMTILSPLIPIGRDLFETKLKKYLEKSG